MATDVAAVVVLYGWGFGGSYFVAAAPVASVEVGVRVVVRRCCHRLYFSASRVKKRINTEKVRVRFRTEKTIQWRIFLYETYQ